MFKKFLPKKDSFFELIHQLCNNIYESSVLLHEMLIKHDNLADYASKIDILENKCDELTHSIINELNETFITPIDREDIHALANSLDDIIDRIDSIATRTSIYKINNPILFGEQLSDILLSQVKLLLEVTTNLKDFKTIFPKLISIRNLETQGDNVFRQAITTLFESEPDVLEVIKQKEILENIEAAIDGCQTATIVIEGILIKNI
jgi:uncharacterized protein